MHHPRHRYVTGGRVRRVPIYLVVSRMYVCVHVHYRRVVEILFVRGVCSSYLAEKVCDDVQCFPAEFCGKPTMVRCIQYQACLLLC